MAWDAIKKLILVAVFAVAVAVAIGAVRGAIDAGGDLRALLPPVTALLACAAAALAGWFALMRAPTPFRSFRAVVAAGVGVLAFYLLGSAGLEARAIVTGPATYATASLTAPVARGVVALLVVMGLYFALFARTPVRRVLENIFAIPELLKKLAFTVALLCIYRVGFHIPLPGLDQAALANMMQQQEEGPFGQVLAYMAMITGGNLRQSTLFGLGIMPYITAAIIFQLLVSVVPALERLQKEGQAGYRKIQEYTRYATVGLCIVQSAFWMRFMMSPGRGLVYSQYLQSTGGYIQIYLMGIMGLTAGTVFLMWLGEQIDEYGIGNGISLIIMAGIVARLPWAVRELLQRASLKVTSGEATEIGLIKIVFLVAAFIFVVAGAILICQAQRRIPIQQAKHTRGRRVYGGQRQYLPLRVNHGGVMPIIFASSLLIFPSSLSRWVGGRWHNDFTRVLSKAFSMGDLVYSLCYVGLIFFFAYFWTTVQFRPKDMSEQLRDYGSFIPGLRPGKRTADYLERVMERITYCGAAFLAAIAVIPTAISGAMEIPYAIAGYMGGTGLLITVAVALDLVQRIEANLIMRNYGGFLGEGGRIRGSRE